MKRRWYHRLGSPRMLAAMLAAACVFYLTSGTVGGYDGGSYAQSAPAPSTNVGAPLPGGTPSTGNLETSGPNGTRQSCSSFEAARGGFLLGRIVPCLAKTIEHAATRMSREMIEMMRPIISAFLTFVIIIFGVQVLQNEGQLQTRAFVLLLKIGFCFTIMAMIPGDEDTNEGGLIGTGFAILAETQSVVMKGMAPTSDNIRCEIESFGDDNTPLIWKQMDCLLGKLYGFTVGTPGPSGEARPNMLLASSVIGLAGGFFFGGSFGVALFLACIGMLASMFMLILRVVMAFLNSYMFIALYMILAPLMLPLMFLRVTTSIFEKWYSGIIAALLLPMIVSAYVVLALQVYDKLFFADDAMITKLFDNQIMDRARQLPRDVCDTRIANSAGFRADATGRTEQEIYTDNAFLQNINPLVSGANNLCGGLKATNLNLEGTFTDENGQTITAKAAFEKLFQDCLKLFIISMLINMGFKTIMGSLKPMLGSGAVVLALNTGTPLEAKLQQGIAGAKQGLQRGFMVSNPDGSTRNTSGAEFLRQLPTAFTESGRGFLSGMGMGMGGGGSSPPPAGNSGGGGSSGASGSAEGGGEGGSGSSSGGSGSNSGAAGGSNRSAGAGDNAPAAPAARPTAANASPAQRREMAQAVLPADELRRYDELENQIYNGRLEPGERDALNDEYRRMLDRIEEELNRRGGA